MNTEKITGANGRKYYQLSSSWIENGTPYLEVLRRNHISQRERGKPFQFSSPPQFSAKVGLPTATWQDAYPYNDHDHWLISDRLKILLEKIDPEAFFFHKTEIDYSLFLESGPNFWVVYITRELDCVDEENSKIKLQENILPEKNYLSLIDIKMRSEVIGSAHAFRLKKGPGKSIVDDVIVSAMEEEKIVGFSWIPIQK